VELQGRVDAIRAQGLGLAAVLYEPPDVLAAFADAHGITFPLLADTGSAVIRRYGILNTSATGQAAGIPYPGTFILDTKGRVTARFFEKAYQERFTASDILARLGGPGPGGRTVRTITGPHLTVRTWPSDEIVAPGERVSVVLDLTPTGGAHVYAPGQEGYLPVAISLDDDPAYNAHPPDYPPAERFYFAPLDEHVRVYSKPFRLVQELTIALSRGMRARAAEAGATLTIKGTLRYQACDDTVCFLPVKQPLEWTVRLRPLLVPTRRDP
jgi:hypothetical protein